MKPDKSSLLFVGDFRSGVEVSGSIAGSTLKEFFNKYDMCWVNLEGSVKDDSFKALAKAGPNIYQAQGVMEMLKNVGFNGFSLANNHIMDYGIEGLTKTLTKLKGTLCVGAGIVRNDAYSYISKRINGIKVGFISLAEWGFGVAESGGGYAWINDSKVNSLVSKAKSEVDYLIVFAHAGVEEIEYPLPEWRERYRQLIDYGADLVVGHHPHVIQGFEVYKGKEIYYSLGNFYFEYEGQVDVNGLAVSVEIENVKGKIKATSKAYKLEKQNGVVEIFNEIKKELVRLDGINDKKYQQLIEKECLRLWDERYKAYYKDAMNTPFSIMGWINRILWGNDVKEEYVNTLLLLHNIKIESHRWAVQRALELINARSYEK